MPVQPSEMQWYLSNPVGSIGYSGIGTPGNSFGRYMSTTQVSGSVAVDNLFLDLSGPQNAAMQVDYQCIFLMNNTASMLSATNIFISFPSVNWTAGGAGLAVGVDPIGAVPYNQNAIQATTISNGLQAPAGVTFNAGPDASFTNGTNVHTLAPQQCIALWIQRTATGSPTLTPQTAQLAATYQSNA